MSISQEIQRIKTNIANAYTQANEKGATLPEVQNSANLASTIESISSGSQQEDLAETYDVVNVLSQNPLGNPVLSSDNIKDVFSLKTLNPNLNFVGYGDNGENFVTSGGQTSGSTMINSTNIIDVGIVIHNYEDIEDAYVGLYFLTNNKIDFESLTTNEVKFGFEYMKNRNFTKGLCFDCMMGFNVEEIKVNNIYYYYCEMSNICFYSEDKSQSEEVTDIDIKYNEEESEVKMQEVVSENFWKKIINCYLGIYMNCDDLLH
jgi:hypothetical protein